MKRTGVIGASARAAVPLPPETAHRGNLRLLEEPLTALFCSVRCPGGLILNDSMTAMHPL